MCSTWLPTVFGVITRASAISLFDMPRATRRSTSTSRAVKPAGPPRPLPRAERPALVPDRVRDPEAAQVVHESGAPQHPRLVVGKACARTRLGHEIGHRARVAERVRRFQVHEVRDREEGGVEALAG